QSRAQGIMAVARRIVERARHVGSRPRTNFRGLAMPRFLAKAAHGTFRRYVSDQIDFLVRTPKHNPHIWAFGRRHLNHEAACPIPSASDPSIPVALENVDIISERQCVLWLACGGAVIDSLWRTNGRRETSC